jgi:hypothetical protein
MLPLKQFFLDLTSDESAKAIGLKSFPKKIKELILDQMALQESWLKMTSFLSQVHLNGVKILEATHLRHLRKDFEKFMFGIVKDIQNLLSEFDHEDFPLLVRIWKTKFTLEDANLNRLIDDLYRVHPKAVFYLEKFGIKRLDIERFIFLNEALSHQNLDLKTLKTFQELYPFQFDQKMKTDEIFRLFKDLKETLSFHWP